MKIDWKSIHGMVQAPKVLSAADRAARGGKGLKYKVQIEKQKYGRRGRKKK